MRYAFGFGLAFAAVTLLGGIACSTSGAKGDTPAVTPRAERSRVTIATVTPPALELAAVIPVTPTRTPAQASATPDHSSSLVLITATSTPRIETTASTSASPMTPASPTATSTPSPTPTPGTPTATPTASATPDPAVLSGAENSLINAHNEARVAQGLPRLTMNPTLMAIARTRAAYMAQVNSMTHYGPNGATVFTLMSQAGYAFVDGGENIHFNSGFSESQSWQTAMTEYLNSPNHRATLLKPNLRRIGAAVATSATGVRYYSIVFSD